ncbi:MAG: hypothetical protein ACKO0Z_19505 [Betaproteobacteria bacterium]
MQHQDFTRIVIEAYARADAEYVRQRVAGGDAVPDKPVSQSARVSAAETAAHDDKASY